MCLSVQEGTSSEYCILLHLIYAQLSEDMLILIDEHTALKFESMESLSFSDQHLWFPYVGLQILGTIFDL